MTSHHSSTSEKKAYSVFQGAFEDPIMKQSRIMALRIEAKKKIASPLPAEKRIRLAKQIREDSMFSKTTLNRANSLDPPRNLFCAKVHFSQENKILYRCHQHFNFTKTKFH
jgi:hypothetical protein